MLRNAVINLTQEGNVESTIKIAKKGLPIVYAVIGAGAVVITDIPVHATAVGVPAKIIKQDVC